jgi:predicted glycosyltransferase involved in capsule biosynthesis
MDHALLTSNKNKMLISTKRSWGGCCFIRKKDYVAAGMDNEVFRSWGAEDIERVKRLEILGYKIKRVPGVLFHLHHEREKSGYTGVDAYCDNIEAYVKICNMSPDALRTHISEWEWAKI